MTKQHFARTKPHLDIGTMGARRPREDDAHGRDHQDARRAGPRHDTYVGFEGIARAPHTRFTGHVYLLSTQEGGRTTGFASNYRPQFYFRATDVVGDVELLDTAVALPGDSVEMSVMLGKPVAMDVGLGFAIREGNRTVGAGTVRELLD